MIMAIGSGSQMDRLTIGVPSMEGSRTNDQILQGELYTNASKTPEYMVKIDSYLNSTTQGFEQYAPLYHFYLHASRETNPNAAQEKKDSGRVIFQNPELIIPSGNYMPTLVQLMLNAKNIDEVLITRLGNIGGQYNQKIEEYKFQNCEIQEWDLLNADTSRFRLRATTFELTVYSFDQKGDATGNSRVGFDLKNGQEI
jgi:hypothetical protein